MSKATETPVTKAFIAAMAVVSLPSIAMAEACYDHVPGQPELTCSGGISGNIG